ncbi:MAG: hypothetical protein EA350_15585 [Gemmatimonadales bacterium]|nr:MAG: hypothetical protein EA350_15585 [Gemmatimonadales bacterium]
MSDFPFPAVRPGRTVAAAGAFACSTLLGVALFAGLSPAPVAAQDHAAHHATPVPGLPDGWMAHFDAAAGGGEHAAHAAAQELSFADMAPGWHIETGPSGIFYRHEFRGQGTFALESEIHLFDPGERRESFGVFFGGSALHDPETRRYAYFLVRRDGSFMIRERRGTELVDVAGWTEHEAVQGWDDRPEGATSVPNVLRVEAGETEVVFLVNGQEVRRVPRADVAVDGHFGLRVNHNLNLHVTRVGLVEAENGSASPGR